MSARSDRLAEWSVTRDVLARLDALVDPAGITIHAHRDPGRVHLVLEPRGDPSRQRVGSGSTFAHAIREALEPTP